MKNKILLMLILPALILSGCEKKLDIVPNFVATTDAALGTMDGLDAAVRAGYFHLHNSIAVSHVLWAELMSDELKYKPAAPFPNYQNYYDRNLRAVAEEQVNATDVRGVSNIKQREVYNAVNFASLTLRAAQNDVAKSDPDFAANKDRVMGECYFIRAVGNFQLLRFFSKPWGATADNSHPGIVINEEPVDDRVSQVKARASVAQVYAFVISDLIKAEALLPTGYIPGVHTAAYNGRAYKDAARGMLARVYFQQQNYTAAKEMIDRLIGPTIVGAVNNLTYHPLAATCIGPFSERGPALNYAANENIYADVAPLNANGKSGSWSNANETLYRTWTSPVTPITGPNGVASSSFIALTGFTAGTPDLRKNAWFATTTLGELMPGKFSFNGVQINLPILRSAEMVLDRAEINAINNQISDALNDLNVTRNRAGLPSLSAPISREDLLGAIQTERLKELCFEGDRLWNLKRLKFPIPAGDRTGGAPLPWDGLETVLKYFLIEQDRNPLLVNNY